MNKTTLKNFFMMLLAVLLIIIMVLVQIPSFKDDVPLTFTLGLIVIAAASIFILYQTATISNQLHANKTALDKISKELDALKEKNNIETVIPEE